MAKKTNAPANWTIMLYMTAENLLANFAIESLKQLKRIAGKGVVVAAQLDVGPGVEIKRYVFSDTNDPEGSIENDVVERYERFDMADPIALTRFLEWVSQNNQASHYALVLWGEGPFLEDSGSDPQNHKTQITRLMPVDLRRAITASPINLEIIGIDACCAGMLEIAYELQNCVKFMIASQEEVPDASLPYGYILQHFREGNYDPAQICAAVAADYEAAYRDYVCNEHTDMRRVTLSGLGLEKTSTLTKPIKELSVALIAAAKDRDLRSAIFAARVNTKDFAAGLYADLRDFCEELKDFLNWENTGTFRTSARSEELLDACQTVIDAIKPPDPNGLVVANRTLDDKRYHGISIYFPFVTDADRNQVKKARREQQLGEKGGLDVPLKLRIDRIENIEKDYGLLRLSHDTGWDKFIREAWSRILVEQVPDELDLRYSGQQCALNLFSLVKKPLGNGPQTSVPEGDRPSSPPPPAIDTLGGEGKRTDGRA